MCVFTTKAFDPLLICNQQSLLSQCELRDHYYRSLGKDMTSHTTQPISLVSNCLTRQRKKKSQLTRVEFEPMMAKVANTDWTPLLLPVLGVGLTGMGFAGACACMCVSCLSLRGGWCSVPPIAAVFVVLQLTRPVLLISQVLFAFAVFLAQFPHSPTLR